MGPSIAGGGVVTTLARQRAVTVLGMTISLPG
jgi:hypothetical protein